MDLDYNTYFREKDNGLQAIISYKDGNRWRQKSKQGFENSSKGKKEAKKWVLEVLKELEKGVNLSDGYKNITFKQFIDIYLDDRKTTLTNNSYRAINGACKSFSELNDMKLKNIKSIDIQRCINKIQHLSTLTLTSYLARVHTIFQYAIDKYNIIIKNPVQNIEFEKKDVKEKQALTESQIKDLLTKMSKRRSKEKYMITLIAVRCGLRIGEILGLTWSDIDFENNILYVNKQWNLKDDKYQFCKLKTKNSKRKVPFNSNVRKELLNFKNNNPINIDNRIFKNTNTNSVCNNLIFSYKQCKYNISVHELRHTYATKLIANGIDFKTAAMLLGHNVEMTMKTYSHVTDDMFLNAKKIIEHL